MCKDQKKDSAGLPSELFYACLPVVTDVKAVQLMRSLKFACFLFSSTHSHVAAESTETEVGGALPSCEIHLNFKF